MHGELDNGIRILIISLFLLIYAGLNFYLGWRGWQSFGQYIYGIGNLYWGLLIFLAASYFLGRLGNSYYPGTISDAFIWIGSYWMGFFFYALLTVLMIDGIRFLDNSLGFLPAVIRNSPAMVACLVLTFLLGLMIYGTYNGQSPVLRQYTVNIPGGESSLQDLHVVMVSDTHLGNIVGKSRLQRLVKKINKLKPDMVLMVGDIIDGDIRPFREQKMSQTLRKLKTKQGVFAVLGNHEYLGGQHKELIAALEGAGITVLIDEHVLLENSFYIIGRDDKYSRNRKSLAELMQNLEQQLPVIVMDHNPVDIEEAKINGADLQLSGHTHTGQIWPLNYITEKIFATDWGYLRQDDLQVIVSNGYATWGPPIRIGNRPELVEIFIHFQ